MVLVSLMKVMVSPVFKEAVGIPLLRGPLLDFTLWTVTIQLPTFPLWWRLLRRRSEAVVESLEEADYLDPLRFQARGRVLRQYWLHLLMMFSRAEMKTVSPSLCSWSVNHGILLHWAVWVVRTVLHSLHPSIAVLPSFNLDCMYEVVTILTTLWRLFGSG